MWTIHLSLSMIWFTYANCRLLLTAATDALLLLAIVRKPVNQQNQSVSYPSSGTLQTGFCERSHALAEARKHFQFDKLLIIEFKNRLAIVCPYVIAKRSKEFQYSSTRLLILAAHFFAASFQFSSKLNSIAGFTQNANSA